MAGLGFVEWARLGNESGMQCDTSSRSDNDEVCVIGLLWRSEVVPCCGGCIWIGEDTMSWWLERLKVQYAEGKLYLDCLQKEGLHQLFKLLENTRLKHF